MFSAFNPSKCTHLEQWAADCAAPGEQSWNSCRSRDSNPQPWVTSGFNSNALSIRPTTALVSVDSKESRECFYCHEVGHLIANCPTLKRKAGRKEKFSKSVVLIERSVLSLEQNESVSSSSESIFEPLIYDGIVSLTEASSEMKRIHILHDTGAAQSFILQGALPFSEQSSCGSSVLVQGIDLTVIKAPLHQVFLRSGILSGNVKLALRAQLPVKDVSLILGNDLSGDKNCLFARGNRNPCCI